MDTNLLDSCREARGELERQYPQETSHTDQKKVSNPHHTIEKNSNFNSE